MRWESSRSPPRISSMTSFTGCGNGKCTVVWIGCVVIICLMTTHASIWCVVIISSRVTAAAISRGMCSGQWIIIGVDSKSSRSPPGISCMTSFAGCGDGKCTVIWIGCVVIICLMATHAGIGCVVIVSSRVTAIAISRGMSSS